MLGDRACSGRDDDRRRWRRAWSGRRWAIKRYNKKELSELLIEGPDPGKDGVSAYTLEDLVEIVKSRWQVEYHPWSMSVAIKRLGFSRQKARPRHPEKDEAAQQDFKGGSPNA
jgi:transposase